MYKTEQETFWAGEFGTRYCDRNGGESTAKLVASNVSLFSKVLKNCYVPIQSVIEFGSNIGLNLIALKTLLPNAKDFSSVEINHDAVAKCRELEFVDNIYNQSILDFAPDYKRDLVLIKCVLIHINPDELQNVYAALYNASKTYICIAEYYNPSPMQVSYRDNEDKLFKRDFCGEIMEKYPDLKLVDYGFCYHRDPCFPADDITWFLMKK